MHLAERLYTQGFIRFSEMNLEIVLYFALNLVLCYMGNVGIPETLLKSAWGYLQYEMMHDISLYFLVSFYHMNRTN